MKNFKREAGEKGREERRSFGREEEEQREEEEKEKREEEKYEVLGKLVQDKNKQYHKLSNIN